MRSAHRIKNPRQFQLSFHGFQFGWRGLLILRRTKQLHRLFVVRFPLVALLSPINLAQRTVQPGNFHRVLVAARFIGQQLVLLDCLPQGLRGGVKIAESKLDIADLSSRPCRANADSVIRHIERRQFVINFNQLFQHFGVCGRERDLPVRAHFVVDVGADKMVGSKSIVDAIDGLQRDLKRLTGLLAFGLRLLQFSLRVDPRGGTCGAKSDEQHEA